MFFKRNEAIQFTEKIMKRGKVPILIYDQNWKKIFSDGMPRSIEGLSNRLKELIADENDARKKLKTDRERKRILMNKIIHLSDRLNSNGDEALALDIENSKKEIEILNEEIEKTYESLEFFPGIIANANVELLKETTTIAYSEINSTEARLSVLDKEIAVLREKLGQLWDEKEGLETRAQSIYTLLHSILGREELEKLDTRFFDK